MSKFNIQKELFQKPLFQVFLIVAICLMVYSNTLDTPFHFDDTYVIVENPIVKDLGFMASPSEAKAHKGDFEFELFRRRYVGYLTFALNYRIHGLNVSGYHIVNLYIHIINALIVYWLVVLTFRTPFLNSSTLRARSHYLALCASLFFACHPVQTQAVNYIWQRVTLLSTTFYCLSLAMYVKWRLASRISRTTFPRTPLLFYLGSFTSAVLAMKTKEIAFTLPAVILLYELMFFEGNLKKRFFYLTPLLLTMLIIPISLLEMNSPIGELIGDANEVTKMYANVSRWEYFLTQFPVILTYIRLIFFPINQNLDYDYPIYHTFFASRVLLSFLLLVFLFGFGIYMFYLSKNRDSSNRLIAFGVFWFFITLSVESSFIPLANVIFEHRMYLPSVWSSIALIAGAFILLNKFGEKNLHAIGVTAFIVVITVLSVFTYSRNKVWSSEISLWQDCVEKSPKKARSHNNLAAVLLGNGRTDDAINHYLEALRLDPYYVTAHINLGNALAEQGRADEAIRHYLEALKIYPDSVGAHYNLGNVLLIHERIDEAIDHYMEAIRIEPQNADAHNNLGLALYRKGDIEGAVARFREVLRINPDYVHANKNLIKLLTDQK